MDQNTPNLSVNRRTLLGAAAIGGVALTGIGGVLFAENLVGPWRLTARRVVDVLEKTTGRAFPGFRRNHAKGVAVSGYLESNGNGQELSKASVFLAGRYRVEGRFSLSGGNPHAADSPSSVLGLGLQVFLPHGEQWRTAMVNLPVFLDATPADFYTRTLAFAPDPATGKPDPQRVARYLAAHPVTAAARDIVNREPPAPSFAASTFRGLNAFEFTNSAGRTVPVRWMLVPENAGTRPRGSNNSDNKLFDELVRAIKHAPLRWKLVITIGERGVDPTHDATKPWPKDRPQVEVGTIVLDRVCTEAAANVRDVNFDPLVLPDGIAGSDDPLLSARSAIYSESYRRRSGEHPASGAVVVEDVR